MNEETIIKTRDEIDKLVSSLHDLKPDSDEYIAATNRLTTLCGVIDNERKAELEKEKLKNEKSCKNAELIAKTALGVGELGILVGLSVMGFKFEETGCISSHTFRLIFGGVSKLIKK